MKHSKFLSVICFCFPLLLAEGDSNPFNNSSVSSDAPSDKKESFLSVVTEVLDKNFILTITPCNSVVANRGTFLQKTDENNVSKNFIFPFAPEALCGVVGLLGADELLKKLYNLSDDSRKIFPIAGGRGSYDISDKNIIIKFPLIFALQEEKKTGDDSRKDGEVDPL